MSKIDYSRWRVEEISSERDDMPPHIKAIKANQLDAESLRLAEQFFHADHRTENVQIEVNIPEEIRVFGKFITQDGELPDVNYSAFGIGNKTYSDSRDIQAALEGAFKKWEAIKAGLKVERHTSDALFEGWCEAIRAMPRAAESIWPKHYAAFWGANGLGTETKRGFCFHEHDPHEANGKVYPGFYLNFTSASCGTVFKDDDTRTLWLGKSFAYALFSTEGHYNLGASSHSVPSISMSGGRENRHTSIYHVYPVGNRKAPAPY